MRVEPTTQTELPRNSAVIVLLEEATHSLILTQRSPDMRHHPGEICFPGGLWQSDDKTLWETALRELREELGIESSRVKLLKQLDPEQTLAGMVIHPWFASISSLIPYHANIREVSAVITIPLQEITQSSHYKEIIIHRDDQLIPTVQFTACHYFIWGATVRIMKQLIKN